MEIFLFQDPNRVHYTGSQQKCWWLSWMVLPYCVEFYEVRIFSFGVPSFLTIPCVLYPQDDFLHCSKANDWECVPPRGRGKLFERGWTLSDKWKNFYKYLAWNWDWRRFSNQSAKLRSLILALQLTELFVGRLKLTIPLNPQGLRRGNW